MMRICPSESLRRGLCWRFCSVSRSAWRIGKREIVMRWVLFAVALYVVIVLQTALMPFLSLHSVRPDLPALFAIHIALAGPGVDAVLAAWIIGLVVDLNG